MSKSPKLIISLICLFPLAAIVHGWIFIGWPKDHVDLTYCIAAHAITAFFYGVALGILLGKEKPSQYAITRAGKL